MEKLEDSWNFKMLFKDLENSWNFVILAITQNRSRSRSRSRTPPSSPDLYQAVTPRPTETPRRPEIASPRSPPEARPSTSRGQVATDFLLKPKPKALPPKRKGKKTKKTVPAPPPDPDRFVYGGFSPAQYGGGFHGGRGRGRGNPSDGPGSYGGY